MAQMMDDSTHGVLLHSAEPKVHACALLISAHVSHERPTSAGVFLTSGGSTLIGGRCVRDEQVRAL